MENITEKLKRLKEIQPDAEYGQRSKLVILATSISPEKTWISTLLDNITEVLKRLKEIQPDLEFGRRSKLAILSVAPISPRKRPLFTLRIDNERNRIINWQLAFTVASLLLVLISGSLMHSLKPAAPNLSAHALETEFKNLNIDIQLAKIDYSRKADETVSLALKEITSKQTSHLNPIILESEQTQLNNNPLDNKDIDNLLDQILL